MAGYKGVGVVFVRQQLRMMAAPDAQLAALATLDDEERKIYQSCTVDDWVPVEVMSKLGTAAAPLLYPTAPDPLFRLGRELARANLTGIFAFLVRFLTVPFLIQQTAKLWSTYHAAGAATSTRLAPTAIELAVTGYPDLPERFRHQTGGYVSQAVEMTGVRDVVVVKTDDDPARWTWKIGWS